MRDRLWTFYATVVGMMLVLALREEEQAFTS